MIGYRPWGHDILGQWVREALLPEEGLFSDRVTCPLDGLGECSSLIIKGLLEMIRDGSLGNSEAKVSYLKVRCFRKHSDDGNWLFWSNTVALRRVSPMPVPSRAALVHRVLRGCLVNWEQIPVPIMRMESPLCIWFKETTSNSYCEQKNGTAYERGNEKTGEAELHFIEVLHKQAQSYFEAEEHFHRSCFCQWGCQDGAVHPTLVASGLY